MIGDVGPWSHALAAALFAALAIWQAWRPRQELQSALLLVAFVATAAWALTVALEGPGAMVASLAESTRNLAWLGFMFVMLKRGNAGTGGPRATVVGVYGLLALALAGQTAADLLVPTPAPGGGITFYVVILFRMGFAAGALLLVHNLYSAAASGARWGIRLPMIALAAMWAYDLNLYTLSYLARAPSAELAAARGLAMALLAPVMALAARRNSSWTMRMSRTAAFQTFALVAVGFYLAAMVLITAALDLLGGRYARTAQIGLVFAMLVAALLLLSSGRFRAWFRVKIAKHLFQHRYDYREEWMRFTDTVTRPSDDAVSLDMRVIQAIADITESPGGVLLLPDGTGGLATQARWNWATVAAPLTAADAALVDQFEKDGRIIELDPVSGRAYPPTTAIPDWILAEPRAWALVPLFHFDRLAGIVLLERPRVDHVLDWEDFDLLQVAGRQVASYLSEARGQEALSEAQRFDEFNRRFAFIMHDIKNLVSQLSLVSRNAERHADNPEFRADMIATLKDSTARLNDLLARLSQHNKGRPAEPRPVAVGAVIEAVAAPRRGQHPIRIDGDGSLLALADPARLEQILGHLVQNAIDASVPGVPVEIGIGLNDAKVAIAIVDKGCGMSADFVRNRLFKPFASTKTGGFGIGAYEANALAKAMGGRIDVDSREGEGSRFTLLLPQAGAGDAPVAREAAARAGR